MRVYVCMYVCMYVRERTREREELLESAIGLTTHFEHDGHIFVSQVARVCDGTCHTFRGRVLDHHLPTFMCIYLSIDLSIHLPPSPGVRATSCDT